MGPPVEGVAVYGSGHAKRRGGGTPGARAAEVKQRQRQKTETDSRGMTVSEVEGTSQEAQREAPRATTPPQPYSIRAYLQCPR